LRKKQQSRTNTRIPLAGKILQQAATPATTPVFRDPKTQKSPKPFFGHGRGPNKGLRLILVLRVPEGPGMLPEIVFPKKNSATIFFEKFPPILYFLLRVRPHWGWWRCCGFLKIQPNTHSITQTTPYAGS
jgi:hypothetical protein